MLSSGVERSFPFVGCARKKVQSHTVLLNLKVISLDAGLRMDGLTALDLRDVVIEVCYIPRRTRTHTHNKQRETASEKKFEAQIPKPSRKEEVTEMLMNCRMWITLSRTQVLLNVKLSCLFSNMAREMGSPRHVFNRRRRTREGYHLGNWCGTHRGGRANQRPVVVPSSRREVPPV